MLVDSLHCSVVFNQVEILVNVMLQQEQYFLKNYASVSDDPIYHSITDKVNSETCKLARTMTDNDINVIVTKVGNLPSTKHMISIEPDSKQHC